MNSGWVGSRAQRHRLKSLLSISQCGESVWTSRRLPAGRRGHAYGEGFTWRIENEWWFERKRNRGQKREMENKCAWAFNPISFRSFFLIIAGSFHFQTRCRSSIHHRILFNVISKINVLCYKWLLLPGRSYPMSQSHAIESVLNPWLHLTLMSLKLDQWPARCKHTQTHVHTKAGSMHPHAPR